jgi:acetolactate synthase-1/2/3 large subunit
MKGSSLMVKCLESEGVRHVFGIPGEENLDLMDSLIDSDIDFVLTRHESSAAFMAGMVGRLTGRPGACLTTLGPGASNMVIGVAEAYLSYNPMVAMSGQVAGECQRHPRKQYIDLVSMFRPITKESISVRAAARIPELTRKAFDLASAERPGPVFVELPEDVLKGQADGAALPIPKPQARGVPDLDRLRSLIRAAERPLVIAGAGVLRAAASDALRLFVSKWHVPAAMTWMGAGAVAFDDELGLNTVGLRSVDMVRAAFEEADLIILVGFDLIEFEPKYWMTGREKRVAYIGAAPCDTFLGLRPDVEMVGDLRETLAALSRDPTPKADWASGVRSRLHDSLAALPAEGTGIKPQHIIKTIRDCLGRKDIAVSDVGAHLIWMAQRYPAYEPNSMLLSNGLIPMGVGVPWAIAAKLVHPERKVVASVGDGSFAMTGMELATAKRLGTPFVTVVWSDSSYELIRIRQEKAFGRSAGVNFGKQDMLGFARSLGVDGHRATTASKLRETLSRCLKDDVLAVIEVDVDATENDQLLVG